MHKGTLIVSMAIKRNGNHMVRNWLECQFERPTVNVVNSQIEYWQHNIKDKLNALVVGLEERHVGTFDYVPTDWFSDTYKVMTLRDPYNSFASRMKLFNRKGLNNWSTFIKHLWVSYAEKLLEGPDDLICIKFNQFVADKEYRKQICNRIGGTHDDTSLQIIDPRSPGSSFDGFRYQRYPEKMAVNQRWQKFKDNERYRSLFTDKIKDLSEQIFDFRPF